jgi:cytochrome c-type biogenesis protein CcmH/NrfG
MPQTDFDSTPDAQVDAARRRLRVDPENIDALVVLATHAPTVAERLALAREAVRIGNALWSSLIDAGEPIHWWRDPVTRPYMRALLVLGDTLAAAGRRDEARNVWTSLSDLDPDNAPSTVPSFEEVEATLPRR